MAQPRVAKFEKLENNVQYWRFGPGIVDVDLRMGLDLVKNAVIGDSYRFEYKVYGSRGAWYAVEKL